MIVDSDRLVVVVVILIGWYSGCGKLSSNGNSDVILLVKEKCW